MEYGHIYLKIRLRIVSCHEQVWWVLEQYSPGNYGTYMELGRPRTRSD